jgi:Beta-L-arabinofuranosidase, GH127
LGGALSNLDTARIQQMLACEHGGMNKVLADLPADTGHGRYEEIACRCFYHDAVPGPMLRGEDRLNGLHVNTQISKVIGPGYRVYEEPYTVYFPLLAADEWARHEVEIRAERRR